MNFHLNCKYFSESQNQNSFQWSENHSHLNTQYNNY